MENMYKEGYDQAIEDCIKICENTIKELKIYDLTSSITAKWILEQITIKMIIQGNKK